MLAQLSRPYNEISLYAQLLYSQKCKENRIIYIIQTLCEFSIFMQLVFTLLLFNIYFIIITSLISDCLYSVSLKTLFSLKKHLLLLITLYTPFLFSPKPTYILKTHYVSFRGLFHLDLFLLHICNSLLSYECFLKC